MSVFRKMRDFFKEMADERFVLHRYKATRFSIIVTAITVVVIYNYDFLVNHIINKNMLIVMSVMVVSKLVAMLYYRFTN